MTPVYRWAAGLCLALAAPGLACAVDLKAKPARPVKPVVEVKPDDKPACGNHGTAIDFVDSPKEAASQAKKAGKLVFILHVSGHFEDPRFT
jgi:hypothetical protein